MKTTTRFKDLHTTYANKRVFVTGHTGFKGTWLTHLLGILGARVFGYALQPATKPSMYQQTNANEILEREWLADIRDPQALASAFEFADPDFVFHLAAQPHVLPSYADPIETFSTNVMGTAHLMNLGRKLLRPAAMVIVTSDKCYANREWHHGYRETDPLGGHDPYSASKACTELVARAFALSYAGASERLAVATARAGNIIGGGDWSPQRLVPDIVRGFFHEGVELRSPNAVRPWQHVLDALHGYLLLGQYIFAKHGQTDRGAWNFGPAPSDTLTVEALTKLFSTEFDSMPWRVADEARLHHEATLLMLDSNKARNLLGWQPKLEVNQAVKWTSQWYRQARTAPESLAVYTRHQLTEYYNAD